MSELLILTLVIALPAIPIALLPAKMLAPVALAGVIGAVMIVLLLFAGGANDPRWFLGVGVCVSIVIGACSKLIVTLVRRYFVAKRTVNG